VGCDAFVIAMIDELRGMDNGVEMGSSFMYYHIVRLLFLSQRQSLLDLSSTEEINFTAEYSRK
jgi:hypothetical protein